MTFDKCPMCGSEVRIVGDTTLHFEPVYSQVREQSEIDAEMAGVNPRLSDDDLVTIIRIVNQAMVENPNAGETPIPPQVLRRLLAGLYVLNNAVEELAIATIEYLLHTPELEQTAEAKRAGKRVAEAISNITGEKPAI